MRKLKALLFVTVMLAMSLALVSVNIGGIHSVPPASAYVWTDQADYHPGSVVTIFVSNGHPPTPSPSPSQSSPASSPPPSPSPKPTKHHPH